MAVRLTGEPRAPVDAIVKRGSATVRQRLAHRLPLFIGVAPRAMSLPGSPDLDEALHRRLTGRWADLTPMPPCPSLR